MTIPSNLAKYLLSAFVLTGLSACSPLRFDMYVRNTTNDTTYFTLFYKNADKRDKKIIAGIRYKDSVVAINHNTRNKLNSVLKVTPVNDDRMLLTLPPHSTMGLSDLIYSIDQFADKTLVIKNGNRTDTIRFNYPYRRIKGVRHKRNSPLNFFYRTILYYDIKHK